MGDVTELMPSLGLSFRELNDRERAAVDWYLKSIAAPMQMDRFIFLWISAEILWTLSDVSVEGPYRADCGHEIPDCPICGRSTSRQMRGRSIQRFLVESLGMDSDIARALWRARQVLHGAEHFDSELIGRLDELTQHLRAGVNQALKESLDIAPKDPPHVAVGQTSILPHVGLLGAREVTDDDLVGVHDGSRAL